MPENPLPPQEVKKLLSSVSSSFCLAKWTQVSIHLQNGTTHSCHHPTPHKIPVELLASNPSALHNTPQKLEERLSMLRGERPKGCDYCWRAEDTPGEHLSDRIYKSGFPWSHSQFQKVMHHPMDETFKPTYVEINLGDICNFKCSYCTPEVSTAWMAEIRKHGPYPTSGGHPVIDPARIPIPAVDANPFREAFWKWWPGVYKSLHTFRVTGGEPLLNKDLRKILEWIHNDPHPELVFAINTNLCAPDELWQRFLRDIRKLSAEKMVKKLEIYTSAEAWGAQAEYIRFGMYFELWRKRVWELLETVPQAHVTIMATYNALSISSFGQLLQEVRRIKASEHLYNPDRCVPIFIDVSYLRYPMHQTIKVLPKTFLPMIKAQVDFMKEHPETFVPESNAYQRGFLHFETEKMERIHNWFASDHDELDQPELRTNLQRDFYRFFSEHDRRRNTDFVQTFPELAEFWEQCSC